MNVVFPLVIQSGTCTSCKHLFISSASLLWMEVNFLNQNLCIQSWPGIFQFAIFLVSFWIVRCVFPLSGLLQVLLFSSHIVYPFSLFVIFGCHIFAQNRSVLWRPVVGMFLCHVLPVVRISYRCFGISCFVCIVLPFVDISLISLLSPEFSGLFPQVVLLFFIVLSFPFCSHIFQDLFDLPFWAVFVDFFYRRFQSNFPSWIWLFLRAFWGDPNFLSY